MTGPAFITPDWSAPANVRAAFTLRAGGVSSGPYASLNVGIHVGDDAVAVEENRRRVRNALSLPGEPVWLEQVHGAVVANLDERSLPAIPRADAAMTRTAGHICAIQVADCMPVLFAARNGKAIAAAHAGWRGLVNGVLEATVAAMGVEPKDVCAWLGPAISQLHFEVGDEVRDAFIARDERDMAAFLKNPRGCWQCDLYALARTCLKKIGVQSISGGNLCTYADREKFFSFRRDSQTGRMAALLWLEAG